MKNLITPVSLTSEVSPFMQEKVTNSKLLEDHHYHFMASLQQPEKLALLKRFTQDFYADPDLAKLADDEVQFFYERGFLPEKKRLYGLKAGDVRSIDRYLSDVQRWLTRLVNGSYSVVFNNKILFDQVFGRFTKVPRTIAIAHSGRMVPYSSLWSQVERGEAGPVTLVAKPLGGGGGGSIYFLRVEKRHVVVETNDSEHQRFSIKSEALSDMLTRQHVPFIINEYIEQGEFSRRLYPLTVNTVRVLVVRDVESGEPHVVRAVLRVGNSESYPIDNFSMGGLSIEIDLESGALGRVVAAEGRFRGQSLHRHPDTGEELTGTCIPGWSTHMRELKALFTQLPYLKYCGFDLILRDNDFIVLEGNSYSQVRLFQMHKPLLENTIYQKFMISQGLAASRG